jgi:protein phosphatase
LVVADGLGGHAAGELASSTAVAIINQLELNDVRTEKIQSALKSATNDISRKLIEQSTRHNERSGLGTTVSLIGLKADGTAYVFHIGDSRVYLMHDGHLERLTKDHTYVQKLIEIGDITEAEATSHPQRALLTQALDGVTPADGDFELKKIAPGDKLLVCTDGLNAVVNDLEIADALTNLEPAAAVTKLVDLALDKGAPDNVTVIVGEVRETDVASKTDPIVVGAAAMRSNRDNLAQLQFPPDEMPSATSTSTQSATNESKPASNRTDFRLIIITSLITLSLALIGIYAALISTQIFVGVSGEKVTIFQGIPQKILFLQLHRPLETTDIDISDLPIFERQQVVSGLSVTDDQAARDLVDQLRQRSQTN